MVPIGPSRFQRALTDLSREELAALVATLYRSRGTDARVVDGVNGHAVLLEDGRRVTLHTPGWFPWFGRGAPSPAEADVVVTTACAPRWAADLAVPVIDADVLRRQALFGISSEDRDELFDRLDCEPSRELSRPRDRVIGTGGPGAILSRSVPVLVGVFAALLIVAGIAAPAGLVPFVDENAVSGAEDAVPPGNLTTFGSPGGNATGGERTAFEPATTTTSEPPPPEAYPPGVSPAGITDLGALTAAHLSAVTGRSYSLVVTYREFEQKILIGTVQQVIFVEAPDRYVLWQTFSGAFYGTARPYVPGQAYADGERRYVERPSTSGTAYRSEPTSRNGSDGFYERYTAAYLRKTLTNTSSRVNRSFVDNGTRFFVLKFSGTNQSNLEDSSGQLFVDSTGVIHRFEWSFRYSETGDFLEGKVTVRYTFENVTVEPPSWYTNGTLVESKNATADDTNGTAQRVLPSMAPPGLSYPRLKP